YNDYSHFIAKLINSGRENEHPELLEKEVRPVLEAIESIRDIVCKGMTGMAPVAMELGEALDQIIRIKYIYISIDDLDTNADSPRETGEEVFEVWRIERRLPGVVMPGVDWLEEVEWFASELGIEGVLRDCGLDRYDDELYRRRVLIVEELDRTFRLALA